MVVEVEDEDERLAVELVDEDQLPAGGKPG